MKVQVGPLTESEFLQLRAQKRAYAELFEMPNDSHAALIWTAAPIGDATHVSPDGKSAGLFIMDEAPTALGLTVPTADLRGGRGHNLTLFGRILESPEDGPRWFIATGDSQGILFQPWLIRAGKPGVRLTAQICWTPTLPKARKSIEIEMDEWSEKDFSDNALRAAAQAMKFLHDFQRHIDGGRPKAQKSEKVNTLANAGVKWFQANRRTGRSVTVGDFGREEMVEATSRPTRAAVDRHMERPPKVINSEVHQRMHELLEVEKSPS